MSSFSPGRLSDILAPVSTGWLLGSCMESKGKQDLWIRQKPEVLKALRDQAIIQSAESSNRIEGVSIELSRLRPPVLRGAKPKDRPEEEIVGYRQAIRWIFTAREHIPIEPSTILRLHALIQGGSSGDAGKWKSGDNEIIEVLPSGTRMVRFQPTSARETPATVGQFCLAYQDSLEQGLLPPCC